MSGPRFDAAFIFRASEEILIWFSFVLNYRIFLFSSVFCSIVCSDQMKHFISSSLRDPLRFIFTFIFLLLFHRLKTQLPQGLATELKKKKRKKNSGMTVVGGTSQHLQLCSWSKLRGTTLQTNKVGESNKSSRDGTDELGFIKGFPQSQNVNGLTFEVSSPSSSPGSEYMSNQMAAWKPKSTIDRQFKKKNKKTLSRAEGKKEHIWHVAYSSLLLWRIKWGNTAVWRWSKMTLTFKPNMDVHIVQ